MAGNYNRVLLMGNLVRDPELRHVSGDSAVCSFTIAVNRRYKAKDGDQREEVTFVDCSAWGRTGEVITKYLAKGRPIFVDGRLVLDQWEDRSGQKRSKLKVVVENFQFVDSGGGDGGAGQSGEAASRGSSSGARRSSQNVHHEPVGEDEIPF